MKRINTRDVFRIVLVLALVAGIGLAFGAVGRFVPTHKIVQPVYCGSCHPEQVAELSETTHLGKFTYYIEERTRGANPGKDALTKSARTNARSISGGCVMCHNFWENMKWYGVMNFDLQPYDNDNPSIGKLKPPTDIYGNAVSPYGLGSTKEYVMNVTYDINGMSAVPWTRGLDTYEYAPTPGGINYSRLDYVWSRLSAVSPGPVGMARHNWTTGAALTGSDSCGAGGGVEHGMCHIAASAVAVSYADKKHEVMDYPNNTDSFLGYSGKGIFFTHEMAFTTAQYAAKPVKICGACHIMKLPPMQWGGEPWAVIDIREASGTDNGGTGVVPANLNDPFGFRPTYNDLTGEAGSVMQRYMNYRESSGQSKSPTDFKVAFRTPDWSHTNVPCIRCHVHAGINKDVVSDNTKP